MNILLMMLRATRPSRLDDMKAIAKPRWIRKGYDGLTFFGTIITHTQQEAEAFNARLTEYTANVGKKYEDLKGVPMVFAVGDGNHSLATANYTPLPSPRLSRLVAPVLSALRLVLAPGQPLPQASEKRRIPAQSFRIGSLRSYVRSPLSRRQEKRHQRVAPLCSDVA